MRLISRIIFSYFSNLTALLIAGAFLTGFEISGNFTNILVAAGVFTLINMYIRPIIRWILTPLVILTLGLFSLVINAFMLNLLDILSENVTIAGTESLIYGTLIITGLNLLLNFSAKHLFKQS